MQNRILCLSVACRGASGRRDCNRSDLSVVIDLLREETRHVDTDQSCLPIAQTGRRASSLHSRQLISKYTLLLTDARGNMKQCNYNLSLQL